MKSICNKIRVTDPAGIWDYKNLIGAQVRILSSSVSNLNNIFAFDSTDIRVIEDIYFRVTTDGKTITIIRLENLSDCVFTWKDLEVINLNTNIPEAVCGSASCGEIVCGDV